jgi:hypothetical protein
VRVALLVALIACGKTEPPPEKSDPVKQPATPEPAKPEPAKPESAKPEAKPAPKPQPGLTAVMDGKPVAVQSVIAVRDSDDQIKVLITNFEQGCDVPTKGSSSRSSTITDLDLTLRLGRYLHPEGGLGWAERGVYWHPPRDKGSYTKQTEHEFGGAPFPKELTLDASAGSTFDLPIAVELEMEDDDTKTKRTLSVKGTAKVTGCGDSKLKRDRVPPEPLGGTIKIAKEELPIRGAALATKKDGRRSLILATHEVVCVDGMDYASAKWPDVAVELEWSKAGKLESARHSGAWVAFASGAPGTLGATPNRPAGKKLAITLGGATTLNGYALALAGKVNATVCATPE